MIQIRNLTKTVKKKKILNNINADLKGITGIIGPNGAGKTTLMKIIAAVINGDKNTEITYNDQKSEDVKIGYLPQQFDIYPDLTVIDVLTLLAQLKSEYDIEYIEELIIQLNLVEYKNKKMKELSGGTVQRVGIAQALLEKPDYLIIDEPTTGLDIMECIKLRNSLLNISKKNIQVIISSHIPEDITSICDYLLVINKGEKIFEGKIDELAKYSDGLTYETILDRSEISSLNKIGIILNIEQLSSQDKLKIKFLIEHPILNLDFYQVDSDFLSGYISLLKGGIASD